MYVYLKDNRAFELIPDKNPAFPSVPIEKRYTAKFLSECVHTDEEVKQGMVYDDGHFYEKEEE